jgi:F-type H+-transporting ATPase subunit epsilon
MRPFSVSILTAEKKIYEGEAVSLVVPAALGFMGILADHAPYLSMLTAGKIVLRKTEEGEPVIFYSKGKGFLEILKNKVTMLLDEA